MIGHRHLHLDERALRYFVAVQESGSIRLAGERIRISPSAISRKLAELELDMGVQLFEKTPRGVRLTAEGERLADYIHERNRRDRALVAELARGSMLRGQVRIGLGEGFVAGTVSNVLPAFREAYPQICVHLEVAGAADIAEAVERDIVDFGVLFRGRGSTIASIAHRAVHQLHVISAAPVACDPEGFAWIEQLAQTPVALLGDRFGIRAALENIRRLAGIAFNVALETTSIQAAEAFALSGTGITFLPLFALSPVAAEKLANSAPLRPRLPADLAAELLVRSDRDLPAPSRTMIDLFADRHPAFAASDAKW